MRRYIFNFAMMACIVGTMTLSSPITAMAAKSSRNSGPGATQFVSPTGEAAETQPASTAETSQAETAAVTQNQTAAQQDTSVQTAGSVIDISVKGLEGLEEVNASSPILGGAVLYMLPSANQEDQILSCIIKGTDGTVIVVDGGLGADKDRLKAAIRELGGTVSAWLVTHPHGDHAGALYKLLEEEIADKAAGITPDINIQNIYYNMASREWYQANDPSDGAFSIELLNKLEQIDESRRHYVSRGTTIMAGSTKIEVVNDRYETDWNKGNNASICYKVWVNGKSILFLGDMSSEGGKRLMQYEKDNLKADIVQMAHHGQAGVEEDVYQAIAPSIALWPTPKWLYNQKDDSSYRINETKAWMKKLRTRNYVVLSNGFVLR